MFIPVIVFLGLALLGTVAENYFAGGCVFRQKKDGSNQLWFLRSVTEHVDGEGWQRVLIPAFFVCVARYLTDIAEVAWICWVALVVLIAVAAFYVYYYYRNGDKFKELIPFMLILPLVGIQIGHVCDRLAPTLGEVPAVIVGLLPHVTTLASGALLVVYLWRKWLRSAGDKGGFLYKALSVILAVALTILAVATGVNAFGGIDLFGSNSSGGNSTTTTTTTTTTVANKTATWYHFYNIDLQYNGDTTDDKNFGPNPYNESWTAKDYDADFRERIQNDPALGAANIAWLDANFGTCFLGKFYESCKHDWAEAINQAKITWVHDENLYQRTLVAFFAYLDTGEVEIDESGTGIVDQMYMHPYAIDEVGVPVVIVLESNQDEGPFLVYKIPIKGNIKEVRYRIPCGYQPVNVEEVMHIVPQKTPVTSPGYTPTKKQTSSSTTATTAPTKSSTKTTATTAPTESSTKTKPAPTKPTTTPSTTSPTKDKSQSNNSGRNNNPDDPGPDTNTGVGSRQSSDEQPQNSANGFSSYEEFLEKMERLDEAQPRTTTTAPPSNATADGNEKEADNVSPDSSRVSEVGDSTAQSWKNGDFAD